MSTIKVTPEQLHHVSSQVDQARQQLENIRGDLTRQIMFIQAMWMGATQEHFYYEFERSKPILEKALESMVNTSKDLKDIATRFQEVDAGQVSLAGATGAVGAMAMTTRLTGNADSGDKGYRMAYNSAFGVWLPVNEKGVTDQAALQAYEKDKGNLDVKGMQGPMNMERPGEDIFALQIKAFENGIHPFTGEPVSDKYAQTMVTSLKLSQVFMAVSMVKGSMPGGKGPFRLPSSRPAVAKIKKNIEASKAKKDNTEVGVLGENNKPRINEGNIRTEPSLAKGASPEGNYAVGKDRGWTKQNESANTFAKEGYHIKMLDEIDGGNGYGIKEGSNPDFLIEGKVFDHYAPINTKSANGIAEEIKRKTKDQADRVILNLDGFTDARVAEVSQKILGKTNPNGDLRRLQELFIIRDGKIDLLFWRE
ncbi:WXG100 family type VII secretion target [Paenibacillus xylanilyticus]|uniref:WXG100 family type VII secretion target n=1 Tax=Paenibacillus xylanilyticus TaxID=248903 RepID=A0A7Y6BZD6_9BACL|nr:WXG100 family type VII secretion target [Paenibacillus xylanilyticus]NUU77373.1 WXG100 family type VII secretion target [Paenibacillus xylanilyticus]